MIPLELEKLFQKALKEKIRISFESTAEKSFGDYATNVALSLSKSLKKPPRTVAEEIIAAIPKNKLIKKTDIAGPGFINIWLTEEAFEKDFEEVSKRIDKEEFGKLEIGKGKIAITDTSNPNVAKPMGVHHLLSTVIGQTVNNLLSACGYKLIKDNYIGDWGTQFGKLMVAIRTWGDMNTIKKDPIPELLKLYVQFHDEVEKHPELEDEGRAEFKKLEDGDQANLKLWEWIREISLSAFTVIWNRLGVTFDMIHGEGYYEDMLKGIIDEAMKKGIAIEGEKGSLIIPMNDPNMPPCIIQKSDGATTYATRDLARIKDWKATYKADIGIVLCDIAQKLHHDQVNEAADKLGWNMKENVRVHFGRMSFPEGKMSTRKGTVVLLEDVMDESEKRALEKIEEHKSELPEPEKKELARIMGIGAIKYNILSQNRFKNYTFVWDQMLSFEGNSAPYLQYAYTRTRSILRKAEEKGMSLRGVPQGGTTKQFPIFQDEEKELVKKLFSFESVIEKTLQEYKSNLLCSYLFELSQAFSHFYNNVSVLDADTEAEKTSRLKLVEATGYVLKKGLNILGIEVPERM